MFWYSHTKHVLKTISTKKPISSGLFEAKLVRKLKAPPDYVYLFQELGLK